MNVEEQLIEQGVKRGEAGFFKRMLVRRFGVLPSWATERVDAATSDQLDQWSERLDAAQALVDVIGPRGGE